MMKKNEFDPSQDGITHINVYSKGKTELGRFLSNFAHSPIELPEGCFASIEGYWYWLNCQSPDKDRLKSLYGYMAKKVGRELGCRDWNDMDEFKAKIINAIGIKLKAYPEMKQKLIDNKLPLTHYYCYGEPPKVINVSEAQWMLDYLASVRD